MKNKILIAFLLMVSILLGSCNINKVPNEDAESIDTTASTIEQTSPEIQTLEPDETIVETPAEIYDAINEAKQATKPFAIIAKTVKGKGVSFMENQAGWHGKNPNDEQLELALKELS